MATNSDHLQEVFGLIDLLYKHIGNGRHAPAVAVEGAVSVGNASGAYSPTNPMPVTPSALGSGTREYNQDTISRAAVGATSTRFPVGALGAAREVALCSNVRLFFRTGDANVAVNAGTGLVLPVDQMHHFRVPAGHTHIAIIGDGGTGFVTFVAVA